MKKKGLLFLLRETITSYITMLILMSTLAIAAAIATFIENDYGTEIARQHVYDSIWYECILTLTVINMMAVIFKVKLYKRILVFLFHFSFVIILIGAGLTRYYGFEGLISIREGKSNDIVLVNEQEVKLPFKIHLENFELIRYPGSKSPSGYKSKIQINDLNAEKPFQAELSMNYTYDYKGYRLFQTSYDTDEKGTILTVNKDPGKYMTYLGYALLFIGLILNLFHPKSRFHFLLNKVNKGVIATGILIFVLPSIYGEKKISSYTQAYLNEHQTQSQELSLQFSKLMVQSRMGRIKPLDTLNREILRKLNGKKKLYGLNANQIVLGIFSRPKLWNNIPLFKVKGEPLRKIFKLEKNQKLICFSDVFDEKGQYILSKDIERASTLAPFNRGNYEKEILKLDERISIFLMVSKGTLLKIFPIPQNQQQKWLGFQNVWSNLPEGIEENIQQETIRFMDKVFARNYQGAKEELKKIKEFQSKYGKEVYPTDSKIESELLYNKLSLFPKLMLAYLLLGTLLFIYAFFAIFYEKLNNRFFHRALQIISSLLLTINLIPLVLRTYISGHAPMSDTYESLVYIAFSAVLAGFIFFRSSLFVLSSSMLLAGIFLFIAHLGAIDPEITNLVPVLKSFWLSLHVSVITASYGFFGIGFFIGFITLILYALFINKTKTHPTIKYLTYINEAYLLLGLTLLIIGNFLGAIWANESWGRYWGWDPKETWAYISIITYIIVLHLRLMKSIYSEFLFAAASVLSFATILMTYFGVNFYLSGKHSYAKGDPFVIPNSIYISIGVIFTVILLAYFGYKKYSLKLNQIIED